MIGPRLTYPAKQLPPAQADWHRHGCRIIQGIWNPSERLHAKIIDNITRPYGNARHRDGDKQGVVITGPSGAVLAKELQSLIFAFDESSETRLRNLGLGGQTLLFSNHDKARCDTEGGQFRRKLLAIREGLRYYEHVVWMDFDCIKLAEIPEDFWDVLRAGAPLQAKIRQYHRRKCHWRDGQKRILQGGAFVYSRSVPLIERCLDAMVERPEQCSDDEMAIAWVIDEMAGGWVGSDKYLKMGFDPQHYTIRGEIHRCESPIFTAR